jgi:hypothetical protein
MALSQRNQGFSAMQHKQIYSALKLTLQLLTKKALLQKPLLRSFPSFAHSGFAP